MSTMSSESRLRELGIDALVGGLIQTYNPEQIYLFGSRARGDARESSDYDFMVIVSDDTPDSLRKKSFGSCKVHGQWVNCDVKIWRKFSFERQLHLKASMPSTILREGILLYERKDGVPSSLKLKRENRPNNSSSAQLLRPDSKLTDRTWEVREIEDEDYDPVLSEVTAEWLRKAKNDLSVADITVEKSPDLREESLFHSQQAIEKVLKAFLAWNDFVPEKIHDLESLCRDCLKIDATLSEVLKPAPALSRWSIDGRYPNERSAPEPGEAEDALRIARCVFDAITKLIPEKVSGPYR
jgi:HEPN domain-containing protein/predicted nucleotidyltransferase